MARALFAVLALLLAACDSAEKRAPFLESQAPPGLAPRFYPPEGWAWGLVRAQGYPPQRYGVAAPPVVPRAEVLIIPGFGESAEVWFETARDLVSRGATVWILDRAGQGGSGRFTATRDVIHVPSFAPDVAAVRALRETVIRARPGQRLFILAGADGAVPALLALAQGMAADGLILSAPKLAPGGAAGPLESVAVQAGFGRFAAPGRRPWRRERPDGMALGLTHDRWRGRVSDSWQLANPDLRVSGASLGWRAALSEAGRLAEQRAGRVAIPVLILDPASAAPGATGLCRRLQACEAREIKGGRAALHLEAGSVREGWLKAVTDRVLGNSAVNAQTFGTELQ